MDTIQTKSTSAMESPKGTRKPFGEITNSMNCADKTPIKEEQPQVNKEDEALTPLANLKMLMRVASESEPSSANMPKRELFKEDSVTSIEDDHDYLTPPASNVMTPSSGLTNTMSSLSMTSMTSFMNMQENVTPSPSSISGTAKVSRKQKSLGLLCEKFMSRFPEAVPEGEKCEIQLDDLAKQMATERRRIYDIVNVLEAVQMMTKVGKNLYQWHGVTHRIPTLAWLKQLAVKLKMLERYNEVKIMEESSENQYNFFGSPGGSIGYSPSPNSLGTPNGISPFSPSLSPGSSTGGPTPSPIERKTSLGVACQKFLMLFLIAPEPNAKINLDFAARVIHGMQLAEAVMKTRIRRLYDIANILQSLHLIQKVQITEGNGIKKPAFQYIGPNMEAMAEVSKEVIETLPSTRQKSSLLAIGKSLLDIPDEEENTPMISKVAPATQPIKIAHVSELSKPLKKRLVAGFHFQEQQQQQKRPASSMTSSIIDLSSGSASSLLDLSKAANLERNKIRRTLSPLRTNTNVLNSTSTTVRLQPKSPQSHVIHHSIHGGQNFGSTGTGSAFSRHMVKPLSPLTRSIILQPNCSNHSIQTIQPPPRMMTNKNGRTVIAVMPPTSGIIDLSKKGSKLF